MKSIHPWELGGTLFVPANHKHLAPIAEGKKFPSLRSMVIDTEDGILESDVEKALLSIQTLLPILKPAKLLRFIRPRNPQTLEIFLSYTGIENIDGFVLPKFGLENMEVYLRILENTPHPFIPSIEGNELFDVTQLTTLRNTLLPYQSRIPILRFGAEDMLRQLGLRRDCSLSLFDMSVPSYVIGSLLAVFKPHGFEISGGVYRCFNDHEGFKRDVLRDLSEGLVSKTIIHPDQIALVESCYRVPADELQEAQALLKAQSAVFSFNNTMAEAATQQQWGNSIIHREKIFGTKCRGGF
ncbi:MAG: HpcH/HpaI aldolase/citrate lyase family protein [Sulfuricurvum sp.]|jgi:citrate lyase beta subunit|uniref:HpcH/HpaI aldolase/citrate lyase family protein n=1 Tax=Sulfuricurvum sp. TaxID=2025608 RepID=UPI0025F14BFA|nr:HpcH/HpaI aldolase/citrate lyase family protein [Sulfuricurvum sp.]MCK9374072.1 HpcH/HpaI aldolase/citrate lyase family protein [Sulfuricurvum sp.]